MRALLLLVPVMLVAACQNTPVAPSPSPSPAPTPASPSRPELIIMCSEELDSYLCAARLYANETLKDVTAFATWSTSDTSIATVSSVGRVTVIRGGEVAIRAMYDGLPGHQVITVHPEAGRQYYRALSGWVRDKNTDEVLKNVRVEIVEGVNAGRVANTGDSGAYQFYDLQLGTFTVQLLKDGYAPASFRFTLTGERYNGVDVRMTPF